MEKGEGRREKVGGRREKGGGSAASFYLLHLILTADTDTSYLLLPTSYLFMTGCPAYFFHVIGENRRIMG